MDTENRLINKNMASKLTHFFTPFLKSDILNDLLSLATNGKSATRKLYIQTKNALKT